MASNAHAVDLDRLNTLTKYPSIPTYHALDPSNGSLLEEAVAFSGPVLLTEKVDGTNARIAHLPDGTVLIGSRNEWLHALGDLVANPGLGIVDAVRPLAERIATSPAPPADAVVTVYGEVYGGKVTGASAQYTGSRAVGFRLFDVAVVDALADRLRQPAAALSEWRESGGPSFLDEGALRAEADRLGVALTPRLGTVDAADLPRSVADADAFLKRELPETRVALDDGAGGQPEGVVLRSVDRAAIAKARLGDYRRTLRRRS